MSTVAWDGTLLAADSQQTCRGIKTISVNKTKIEVVKGERFAVATLGDTERSEELRVWWLENRARADFPAKRPDSDAGILVVANGSGVLEIEDSWAGTQHAGQMAWGSGAMAALAAMRCGLSAPEAVRVACGLDIYSCEPVVTVKP